MEDKKLPIKLYTFTYGKGIYILNLVLAAFFFLYGVFSLFFDVKLGIALIAVCLFFVLFSFLFIYLKYLNYITMTDSNVSTKKQTFSWDDVKITMSYYFILDGTRREDYYIFFDDHYLNNKEIYSRRVKKNAFYLMVTPKRLEIILEKYNNKIQLLDRLRKDRKKLYDKVIEYNQALDRVDKES